jgi:predicted short-subunit dehydrogenase-like oxidoreductase (DUF2520 family)
MKIVLLGSGRLAWHLGPALQEAGAHILQVYSRDEQHAKNLAERLGVASSAQISQLSKLADLYIIAVSDIAIVDLAKELVVQISSLQKVVHTSGATPGTVLEPYFKQYGVFYPLHSFTKEKAVDFSKIPLCIDANESELARTLNQLAQKLGEEVYRLNDAQRAQLHLAAVFANNFVNHILGISHHILAEAGISKNILQNIIKETILKLESADAADSQTGPAIRGDWPTLVRHEKLLSNQPGALELYRKLSDSIIKSKKS